MSTTLYRTAAVLAAGLLLVGCNSTKGSDAKASGKSAPSASQASDSTAPGGTIPVGAGPQKTYTVQTQPPAGSCHWRYTAAKEPLPDSKCTPGATSPAVTQATIKSTICKPGGYTSTIRPPVSITGKEKAANAKSYGYSGPLTDYEYDHLISLQLGGDPNDPRNLWVEPPSPGHKPGAGPNNDKDTTETHLHTAICSGKVTLIAAQQAIATDWTTAESKLGVS